MGTADPTAAPHPTVEMLTPKAVCTPGGGAVGGGGDPLGLAPPQDEIPIPLLPGCRRADQSPTPAVGPGSCTAKNGAQQMAAGAGSAPPFQPSPSPPSDLTTAGQGWRPTPPSPTPCLSFPISCDAPMHAVGERFPPQPPPCLSLPIAVTPQHTHRGSGGGEGGATPPVPQFPL